MSDVSNDAGNANGSSPVQPVDLVAELGPIDSLTFAAEMLAEVGGLFGRMAATPELSPERAATFGLCAVVAATAGSQVSGVTGALDLLETELNG